MKRFLSISALLLTLLFNGQALAAGASPANMTASGAIVGSQILWCPTGLTADLKCTFTQVATFINSLFSADFTVASGGAATLATVNANVGSFGSATACTSFTVNAKGLITAASSATCAPAVGSITGLGAGVATALAIAPGSAGAFVTFGGAGGTPSSITLTNGTGLPFTGVTGRFALSQAPQGIANSIWINPTGSTADMQNVAVPACANDGIHALVYINGTGLQCASLTTGGAGTVTSVSAGCGTSTGGSAITTTGTVAAALTARTNTATSGVGADFVSTDCGGIVYDNSASSIAVSLPVATTSGFGANTFFGRCNINAGVSTITPVTSTIGGAATLVVGAGTAAKPTCVYFRSDGTNYFLTETPLSVLATTVPGTNVAAAIANTLSSAGGLTSTIASGTAALGTSAIASGACATVVTVTATNVATTDVVSFSYNGDPTAVTGYGASATGAVLTVYPYPTSGNVNVKVCNSTASSITPSAMTLNWRVFR